MLERLFASASFAPLRRFDPLETTLCELYDFNTFLVGAVAPTTPELLMLALLCF